TLSDPQHWMAESIAQLARVARTSAQKYTRSKVRKRLQPQFAYILEELLSESQIDNLQKEQYYLSIINSILALGEGQRVIITLANSLCISKTKSVSKRKKENMMSEVEGIGIDIPS